MSRWISADPILGSYLTGKPAGGVFDPINLNLYHYAGNNPVKYIDPDGNSKKHNLRARRGEARFQQYRSGLENSYQTAPATPRMGAVAEVSNRLVEYSKRQQSARNIAAYAREITRLTAEEIISKNSKVDSFSVINSIKDETLPEMLLNYGGVGTTVPKISVDEFLDLYGPGIDENPFKSLSFGLCEAFNSGPEALEKYYQNVLEGYQIQIFGKQFFKDKYLDLMHKKDYDKLLNKCYEIHNKIIKSDKIINPD